MRKLKKTRLAGLLLAACLAGYQCGIVSTAAESGDADGFAAEVSRFETDAVQNAEVSEEVSEDTDTQDGLEKTYSEETGTQTGLEDADSEKADTEENEKEVIAEGDINAEEANQEETKSDEEFESTESEGFTDEVISNFSDNDQTVEATDSSEVAVTEGNCGMEDAQLFWKLNENGTLEITGTGNMLNWEKVEDVPWAALREKISRIEIAEGVLSVGAHAFSGCRNVTEIQIPESVQEIGEFAFFNCSAVSAVTIG